MFRKICGLLAWLLDRTICYDIAENKERALKELQKLVKFPAGFGGDQLQKFQMENAIMDRFATEKNNRLIGFMTFIIMALTVVLLLKN